MTSTVDEVRGIKWIYDKTTKKYIDRPLRKANYFYVYLGQYVKSSGMWPRLRMGFRKENWIFFNKIIVNFDGQIKEMYFNKFDVERDVLGASSISEYVDVVAEEYSTLIKSMAQSKKVIVRFEGRQYYHDFTMTKEQKNALANIWRLYELMK